MCGLFSSDKWESVHLARKVNQMLSGGDHSWCGEIVMAFEATLHHRRLTGLSIEIHDVRTPWRM
jgi:hypothetical protein